MCALSGHKVSRDENERMSLKSTKRERDDGIFTSIFRLIVRKLTAWLPSRPAGRVFNFPHVVPMALFQNIECAFALKLVQIGPF